MLYCLASDVAILILISYFILHTFDFCKLGLRCWKLNGCTSWRWTHPYASLENELSIGLMHCHKIQKPTKVCKYETSGEPKFHPGSSTPVKFVPRCNIVVKCQHRRCELFRGGTSAIANQGSRFAFFIFFYFAQFCTVCTFCKCLQFFAILCKFCTFCTTFNTLQTFKTSRQLQTTADIRTSRIFGNESWPRGKGYLSGEVGCYKQVRGQHPEDTCIYNDHTYLDLQYSRWRLSNLL